MELISSFDREIDIYKLIALSKLPVLPNRNEPYHIEGYNDKENKKTVVVGGLIEDELKSYEEIGFIEFAGDKILLTQKGKAFVDLAEEKGYVIQIIVKRRKKISYQNENDPSAVKGTYTIYQ